MVLILDTCALIYDALTPSRLSKRAAAAIENAALSKSIAVSDITLWEVAMLIEKKRLDPGTDTEDFLQTVLDARGIEVLPITVQTAAISATLQLHGDPADRLITATGLIHNAPIVTSDRLLRKSKAVKTVW